LAGFDHFMVVLSGVVDELRGLHARRS
jgi:hypothetical protein